MSRYTNIFNYLPTEENDSSTTSINEKRKAGKKLREIECLKKKNLSILTDLEKEKIASEKYWKDILSPPPVKENLKEERKRLKKEKEKQKKEAEREEVKKRQQREKEEFERTREKRAAELRKYQESLLHPVEVEYKKKVKEYDGNTDKAFRVCSRKYHPDKNIGNEVEATENQKKLAEVHEGYSKK
jgi:hypothetical protein